MAFVAPFPQLNGEVEEGEGICASLFVDVEQSRGVVCGDLCTMFCNWA